MAVQGHAIAMLQCSCKRCQAATGGGHSSIVLLPADVVRVVGATKTFIRPADSGAQFTRHFCLECGTTLYAESSRAPAFRIIPVGIFRGDNDWFEPNQLIFAGDRPHWDLVREDIPHYEAYRPETPK